MNVYVGLCGRNADGIYSSGRGEQRWALSLARCLSENLENKIWMAPDTEQADWGTCPKPDNIELLQAHERRLLNDIHFDVGIFTSWQDNRDEARYIHADKYVWGIMGWKGEIMKDGYFAENEYVARWFRADVPAIPFPINFEDRCFLLAQPFGERLGESKFYNKTIGWVAKEAFMPTTPVSLSESAARHMYGIVRACKKTGANLSVFSCHELNPTVAPRVSEYGIDKMLDEIGKQVIMYPNLPFLEYQRELAKCSVTVPLAFAGSIQESIFNGILPLMYKDCMFSNHPWIKGACESMTGGAMSRFQSPEEEKEVLSGPQIGAMLESLLTDKDKFDSFLNKFRPMVMDNLDSMVIKQLNKILRHEPSGGE